MIRRETRLVLFGVGAVGLGFLLVEAALRIPASGAGESATARVIGAVAVPERHATDVVAAVTFDYRGFDTLGEEFILYASVLGATLLLRDEKRKRRARGDGPEKTRRGPSDAIRIVSQALVGPIVVVGLYLIAHGHQTPGGGFQGGVLLSTAPLLAYLAAGPDMLERIAPPELVELAEGLAAAAYLTVGFLGLIRGGAYLQNVLPLGTTGRLLSAGTIPLLNAITGLAVAAGLLVLLSRFVTNAQQTEGDRGDA